MKHVIVIVSSLLLIYNINGQDITVPQKHVVNLASYKMQGRGYVKNGDKIAADYLRKQLYTMGIEPLAKGYNQSFSFPMNSFPGKMEVQLDSKKLKPVFDFVIAPECKGRKGRYELHYLPLAADTNDAIYDSIIKIDYTGKFIVADFDNRSIRNNNPFKASGVIMPKESVYWWGSTGYYEANRTTILIVDSLLKDKPESITVNFDSKFLNEHKTQNVVGWIEGKVQPDSFLVFTAHYDHLGMMGKGNVFLGANDNASGTAMILWLAEYFAKEENKPNYSIAFLLFAGEETGLHGSRHFAENPLIQLDNIKALINLDMVGSGSEGIALVNGKANPHITSSIDSINNVKNYFKKVKVRGESCSSDHCFFHKAGVPSVFIYTMGDECKEYHNLKDTPQNTPLSKFWDLRELLIEFANSY